MTAPTPTLPTRREPAPGQARRPLFWWLVAAAVAALAVLGVALVLLTGGEEPAGTIDDGTAPVDGGGEPAGDPDAPAGDPDAPGVDPAPPGAVRYGSEPPANWDVTGVAAGDVLNARTGPGTGNPVIATLAPGTVELESTGRIARTGDGALWREIKVPGATTGWVNARYLAEHRPPAWLDGVGVGLPAPATITAREIALAAQAGRLEDLAALALDGDAPFTASFGADVSAPAHLVALWEGIGREEVLRTLGALVALPDWHETTLESGGQAVAVYVTPRFMHDPTAANHRLLEEALGAETVAAGVVDGDWLGWRLGISADGDWRFFVAGD